MLYNHQDVWQDISADSAWLYSKWMPRVGVTMSSFIICHHYGTQIVTNTSPLLFSVINTEKLKSSRPDWSCSIVFVSSALWLYLVTLSMFISLHNNPTKRSSAKEDKYTYCIFHVGSVFSMNVVVSKSVESLPTLLSPWT